MAIMTPCSQLKKMRVQIFLRKLFSFAVFARKYSLSINAPLGAYSTLKYLRRSIFKFEVMYFWQILILTNSRSNWRSVTSIRLYRPTKGCHCRNYSVASWNEISGKILLQVSWKENRVNRRLVLYLLPLVASFSQRRCGFNPTLNAI
jgi:hypothetical protein